MIKVDEIKQLVVDLILAEIDIVKSFDGHDSDKENILFNMRLDPKLVCLSNWERGLELDSEVMQKIQKSESL